MLEMVKNFYQPTEDEGDMHFNPGDIVTTKLHRNATKLRCVVVHTTPCGAVVIQGRCGKRMRLLPYQIDLVRRRR